MIRFSCRAMSAYAINVVFYIFVKDLFHLIFMFVSLKSKSIPGRLELFDPLERHIYVLVSLTISGRRKRPKLGFENVFTMGVSGKSRLNILTSPSLCVRPHRPLSSPTDSSCTGPILAALSVVTH